MSDRAASDEEVDQPEAERRLDRVREAAPLLGDVLVGECGDDAGQVPLDGIDVELHDHQYDIKMMSVKCPECDVFVMSRRAERGR